MAENRFVLKATDLSVLVYLIITGTLIFVFPHRLLHSAVHLYFRLAVFLFVFLLLLWRRENKTRFLEFIHLFYPILILTYTFGETAWFNHVFFSQSFDHILKVWDGYLFGFQPSIEFSKRFSARWIGEVLNLSYFSYYFMTFGVALAFYFRYPDQTERIVFVIVTSFFIYYLFFIAFPGKGPQYYFPDPLNKAVHSGLFSHWVQTVEHYGDKPTGAFPSSHVGMAVIYLLLTWRKIPWLFWLLLPFALLICLATVYVKAHYAVDVLGGLVSAPLVYVLSEKIYRLVSRFVLE